MQMNPNDTPMVRIVIRPATQDASTQMAAARQLLVVDIVRRVLANREAIGHGTSEPPGQSIHRPAEV
jgi:hypothetical protein